MAQDNQGGFGLLVEWVVEVIAVVAAAMVVHMGQRKEPHKEPHKEAEIHQKVALADASIVVNSHLSAQLVLGMIETLFVAVAVLSEAEVEEVAGAAVILNFCSVHPKHSEF